MKTKFKSQRKGAVLATVTVVSIMMVVIISAAAQLVAHTNYKTNEEYRKKQAYYVAQSCIRAFVEETTGMAVDATHTDEFIGEKIKQLQDIAATNKEIDVEIQSSDMEGETKDVALSQPRWSNASCKLKVEEYGGKDTLKVISTATYLGQKKTVVAYLTVAKMKMHKFTPKALEIIGTDGGNSRVFENIQVYGATGATSTDSNDQNTVYQINHNQNELYGNVDINGSLSVQNANIFRSNPYYYPGVDDTMGCVVNVTRSMVFTMNVPRFKPDFDKPLTDMSLDPTKSGSDYNYLNVHQGLIFCSDNAQIGDKDKVEKSVDVHAGTIYFGRQPEMESQLKVACARKSPADTTVDVDAYWERIAGKDDYGNRFGFGNANGNTIVGNVFTHKDKSGDSFFNGDMIINGVQVNVIGDIYLDGDLYLCGSNPQLTANKVHLLKDHHVYNYAREYDASGNPKAPNPNTKATSVSGFTIDETGFDDWASVPRATQPDFPTLHETPYYYYPEHLLCQEGVSTIKDTYEKMYVDGTDDLNVDHDNPYHADSDHVPQITDDRFRNKNSDGTYKEVYGDLSGEGPVFRPDYVVTESCYINVLGEDSRGDAGGAYILIDVDKAKKDIVVVLKDEGYTRNNNMILVKNTTDPDDNDPNEHFVYFVSDSGVGTTYNEYATSTATPKPESTYDHSTFKTPTFEFRDNTVIMDLESYFHSNVYNDVNGDPSKTRAKCSGGSLNPTADKENSGYKLHSNHIFYLGTEGSTLYLSRNETIMQACLYMPRATYKIYNKGKALKIDPYFTDSNMQSVSIIGNLVCNHYEVMSGNNNAIVYLGFSPYSMLSIIKGEGDEHLTTSYMLHHYAAS